MPRYDPRSCGRGAQQHAWSEGTEDGRGQRHKPTEVGAAVERAFGEGQRQARRHPGLRAGRDQAGQEQADLVRAAPERMEQRQAAQERELEWLRDHSKTQERPAGQERTEAGDMRALEHRHPAAAPPSAEDRTPIEWRETLRGELLATLGHDCRRV